MRVLVAMLFVALVPLVQAVTPAPSAGALPAKIWFESTFAVRGMLVAALDAAGGTSYTSLASDDLGELAYFAPHEAAQAASEGVPFFAFPPTMSKDDITGFVAGLQTHPATSYCEGGCGDAQGSGGGDGGPKCYGNGEITNRAGSQPWVGARAYFSSYCEPDYYGGVGYTPSASVDATPRETSRGCTGTCSSMSETVDGVKNGQVFATARVSR